MMGSVCNGGIDDIGPPDWRADAHGYVLTRQRGAEMAHNKKY
jgi:hypothetical protein